MKIPVQQGYVTSDIFFDVDRWAKQGAHMSPYGGLRYSIKHSLEKNTGTDFWEWYTD